MMHQPTSRNDEQFWREVEPLYGRLCAFARHTLPERWEDLLQESLLIGLCSFKRLRDRGKFRAWIFRILANEAGRQRKREFWRRFRSLDAPRRGEDGRPTAGAGEAAGPGFKGRFESADCAGDPHEMNLRRMHLRAALARLNPARRRIVLLYYVAGFSLPEISEMLGESLSASKSRLSRARRELRGLLEGGLPLAVIGRHREKELDHDIEEIVRDEGLGGQRC